MLTGLLTSVAVPVLVDFFKGAAPAVSRKMFGVSVDDQIKIEDSNVRRLEAIAKLDNPHGTPSQWVINLRASFRYIAAAALIFAGVVVACYAAWTTDMALFVAGVEMAGSPFGFIFGERLVLSYKPGSK